MALKSARENEELTVQIQTNVGIAFAQAILCGDFVFATIAYNDVIDLQTGHIGVVRQGITRNEKTSRIRQRFVILCPNQFRFRISRDFTFEDQSFSILFLFDNWLLNKDRRNAIRRAKQIRSKVEQP